LPAVAPAKSVKSAAAAPASAKSAKSAAPASASWKIYLDRFDFTKGTATFEDGTTSPTTTLTLTDVTATAERVAFPSTTTATGTLSLNMPGGGRSEAKAVGKLEPLDLQIRVSTRDAPIEPYRAYFPFPARFLGVFGGDSLCDSQRAKDGRLIIASMGDATVRDVALRAPGADSGVARRSRLA